MNMKMKNGLPSIAITIDHQPKAGIRNIPFFGDFVGQKARLPHPIAVLGAQLQNRTQVNFWNQQDMGGSLGGNILKSERILGLFHFFRWNLTLYDFTKQTIVHHLPGK